MSIVIAARNAAGTLADTLASVQAQTHPHWEVIVVVDGGEDATARLAADFAAAEPRADGVETPGVGVSAARNVGIARARGTWLLFLDADDTLHPQHLEALLDCLDADPTLDAAYCGWERTTPGGQVFYTQIPTHSGDLFPVLTGRSAFTVHSCLVRRSVVQEAGGFDEHLQVGEDWDLWQRLARSGVRFGLVPEALVRYRMHPGSASADGLRLLQGAIPRIEQGHTADPRVAAPLPRYADGLQDGDPASAKYAQAVWCAGYAIGRGHAFAPLLALLVDEPAPALDPEENAATLFHAVVIARCEPPDAWLTFWPGVSAQLSAFLTALESQTGILGLAPATLHHLERLVLDHAPRLEGACTGTTVGITVEVTEGVQDLSLPDGARWAHVRCLYRGEKVGTLDLPVCDGRLTAYVLADALADAHAWRVLGRFLGETVYPTLTLREDEAGLSAWRGNVCLAASLPDEVRSQPHLLHDYVGWTVLLQELFGRPDWDASMPYRTPLLERLTGPKHRWDGETPMRVELSHPLPKVRTRHEGPVPVIPVVGGCAQGLVWVEPSQGGISAGALRIALLEALGYELCRACVREGVLRPSSGGTLRERLAEAPTPEHDPADSVLARRQPTVFGTSVSRRVAFPAQACADVRMLARAFGEAVLTSDAPEDVFTSDAPGKRCGYAPDLLRGPFSSPTERPPSHEAPADASAHTYERSYFESLFASGADPWKYTTAYEQVKYEQTLDLLPAGRFARALELACAEGHFTLQLAPRVDHLVAADISEIALERAARRAAAFDHIEYRQLDLARDPIPGHYDLIVCSEVLYYMGSREALRDVAARMRDALAPGGVLVMAHAHVVADEPDRPGFDWDVPYGAATIADTYATVGGLVLRKELRTPLYRIQVFQRSDDAPATLPPPERIVLAAQPTPLEPHAAARALWAGGTPRARTQRVETARLPILMYHRVAPTGDPRRQRYRLSPEAFEQQLRYLRAAGYRGVTLDDWRVSLATRRPLPGRAVLLTFDDGYADFAEYAWPLLRQYGFPATVFLVSGAVGGVNAWDARYGERVPLMDWSQIRTVQRDGVVFGSHTHTHPYLTSLPPDAVIAEGVRSRLALEDRLGTAVEAISYPYGAYDPAVGHLLGGCGYLYGLTTRATRSSLKDDLIALPRLEITGADRLETFIARLG